MLVLSPHIVLPKCILSLRKEEKQRSTSHVVTASTATMLTNGRCLEIFGSVTSRVNAIMFGTALVYGTFSPQKELWLHFVFVRLVSL